MTLKKIKKDLAKLAPTTKDIDTLANLIVSIPPPLVWLTGELALGQLQTISHKTKDPETGEEKDLNPLKRVIDLAPIPIPYDPLGRNYDFGRIEYGSIMRVGWLIINMIYAFGAKRTIGK